MAEPEDENEHENGESKESSEMGRRPALALDCGHSPRYDGAD